MAYKHVFTVDDAITLFEDNISVLKDTDWGTPSSEERLKANIAALQKVKEREGGDVEYKYSMLGDSGLPESVIDCKKEEAKSLFPFVLRKV